ncbi:DegT/DnrJ/EryC1/StrS family aminotransferase [Aliikangiella marina]|nr:DegT/DnrJ/EryC1/StrS family aminotransferase [Aliikangiella marina]
MKKNKVHLLKPRLPDAEMLLPFLRQIDQNRWYTNFGPLNQKLTKELERHFTDAFVATTSSGTSALEVAISSLNLKRGAKILVPALTFPATATAVSSLGYQPIISDIDPDSWQLTPKIACDALKHQAFDAVIPVATFGLPVNQVAWDEFVAETDIPVIVDAAGAFGNQNIGCKTITVFSTHATKSFSTGEGGLIVSNNRAHNLWCKQSSNFGIDAKTKNVDQSRGCNAKQSEYHAAVGLASLSLWEQQKAFRLKLLSKYLDQINELKLPVNTQPNISQHVLSTFVITFGNNVLNKDVQEYLANKNIETRRWYCPILPQHSGFQHLKCASDLKHAKQVANSLLGLPFHLEMTQQDVDRVCNTLSEFLIVNHDIAI